MALPLQDKAFRKEGVMKATRGRVALQKRYAQNL